MRGPVLTKSRVAKIAERATGQIPSATEPITGRGLSNHVWIVTIPARRLVVRTNTIEHFPQYQKEAWCLDLASQAGILVPKVIACGTDDVCSFSIANFIEDAEPINSGFDRLRVWEVFGKYCARLNKIPITGYGSEMSASACFTRTWKEELNSELGIIFRDRYWEQQGVLSEKQIGELRASFEGLVYLSTASGICHFDICCENALIRNANYDEIYLLDLELAVAGPVPHFQFACVAKSWGHSSNIMKAFAAGYGLSDLELREMSPNRELLTILRYMRSVRWAQDRNPEAVDQFTKETKAALLGVLEKQGM